MYTVYWLIAVAVFLLLEILTLGLTSIWFAVGSLAAAIGAGLGLPFFGQLILAVAVSCVVFVFARPWAQKYLNNKTEKTNAERKESSISKDREWSISREWSGQRVLPMMMRSRKRQR